MPTFDYIVLVSHKTAFTDLQFDINSPDYLKVSLKTQTYKIHYKDD